MTKFHPASLVEALYGLGVRDVGENRQQELSDEGAGRRAAARGCGGTSSGRRRPTRRGRSGAAASVVHSIDRARIADAFDAAAGADDPVLDVLLQVNLTDDPGRGGVAPDALESLAEHVTGCRTLRVRGVMAVAPLDEPPAAAFERLRGYADRVRAVVPDADWISAGMTADFAEAIAAGATHLRIGSAITGPRPLRG